MIPAVANHLLQSTVFAVVAGMLTLFLRNNRARTRYWIWLAASMKFLVPFSLFVEIGHRLSWRTAPVIAQPRLAVVMAAISQPFSTPAVYFAAPVRVVASAPSILPSLLLAVWICGCAAVLIFWWVRWRRVAASLRMSVPVSEGHEISALRRMEERAGIARQVELLTSTAQVEPGVFGILRQKLWMPAGIAERLEPEQLEAIFAHELCHIRNLDNLTAAFQMLVEAVFWFHPLVWWIGARLVEERERACDEEVVRLGTDPDVYAEGILNVCKLYLESPLVCVSGVTGSDLKERIEAIMSNRVIVGLGPVRKVVLAIAGIAALALPVFVGIVHAPGILAQVMPSTPKFEVASIRPGCADGGNGRPVALSGSAPGFEPGSLPRSAPPPPPRRTGGIVAGTSPGRLNECYSLADLIHIAYVMHEGGQFHGVWGEWWKAGPPVEGGPAWVQSDPYTIEATAEGTPSREMMRGPMLQALLEDRFKLKIHRGTRDVPVYALTVAKGGPKLIPSKDGSCILQLREPGNNLPPALAPGQKTCMDMIGGRKGSNTGLQVEGGSLDDFSMLLSKLLDRPVVNKTGIAGKFDIHLEFAIDESTPRLLPGGDMAQVLARATDDPAAPSIFTVVEKQLGLKLDSTKGPGEFLAIDHVARPSEN